MNILDRLKSAFKAWRKPRPNYPFAFLFRKFQGVLELNNAILERMAEMGAKLSGDYVFDKHYIEEATEHLGDLVQKLIYELNLLSDQKYIELYSAFQRIQTGIQREVAGERWVPDVPYILPLTAVNRDLSEETGAKSANLGEVKNAMGIAVADGFAITTRAFHDMLEHCKLAPAIDEVSRFIMEVGDDWTETNETRLDELAGRIRTCLTAGWVPEPLTGALHRAVYDLIRESRKDQLFFAVRSSATGEDSEYTFAGQHESLLNVPSEQLLEAYCQVVASAYTPSAWRYRVSKGFREQEMAMAVCCQVMVPARASGVLYTMDPIAPERDAVLVSAVWGLGGPLVAGAVQGDSYRVDRTAPHVVRTMKVVQKPRMLKVQPGGGVDWETVPEALQHRSCLSTLQLQELVRTALFIERYYKRAQDIEWAFDENARLLLLQTRPLKLPKELRRDLCRIADVVEAASVLISGKGTVVQRGIATGKVFVVRSDDDLLRFPHGAILVTAQTAPRLARVIRKAGGIVTDVGSATGHMATVAREFRVPTVVDTGCATRVLHNGDEITLDATENVIYRGLVPELCYFEMSEEEVFEESLEYRLLRRILRMISPLNVLDRYSATFAPSGCRTIHDITRFVHEKAVEELIRLSTAQSRRRSTAAKRLVMGIPLGLLVIDIDGGTTATEGDRELRPEQMTSTPMRAFLEGLREPGLWGTEPVSVDFGSFMSSVTRTFSTASASPEEIGRNLAVVSREYMNLNLRLGYHFNIIDAYVVENINDNYAYFRFLGGVSEFTRRSRRARLIAEILEREGFRVEVRGDLVVGRIKKLNQEAMKTRMKLLGALVAYTRQLDVQLESDDQLSEFVEDFERRSAVLKPINLQERGRQP